MFLTEFKWLFNIITKDLQGLNIVRVKRTLH